MPSVTLDQVLACPHLPSLPAVAVEVLALTSKADVNLEEIAQVVQNDQALCAKILKTVNSSFYGLSKPCPTITRAISYLGLSTVKSLVLGFSLVDATRISEEGFDLIDYWRRCIYSAAAARSFAMGTRVCDPEEAFIAALMQDVGMSAIYNAIGPRYQHIISRTEGDHNQLAALERESLGFDHAKVGCELARRWRLPVELIEAIRLHHTPQAHSPHQKLVQTVALASRAAASLSYENASEILAEFRANAAQWFAINADSADMLLTAVAREASELSRLFQINTGEPADINTILAQAEEASLQHQLSVERESQELRRYNSTLAQMALTDALTGVGNRKQFDAEIERLFAETHAANGCLAVIMMDADHFKSLNDTYGHQAGDLVLIELAKRLQEQTKTAGAVCRYGGEEFVAIIDGADRRTAARIAEFIRLAVASTPFDVSEAYAAAPPLTVTISLGVSVLDPASSQRINTPQLLVRAADRALYAAKAAGRNCVRVFHLQQQTAAA